MRTRARANIPGRWAFGRGIAGRDRLGDYGRLGEAVGAMHGDIRRKGAGTDTFSQLRRNMLLASQFRGAMRQGEVAVVIGLVSEIPAWEPVASGFPLPPSCVPVGRDLRSSQTDRGHRAEWATARRFDGRSFFARPFAPRPFRRAAVGRGSRGRRVTCLSPASVEPTGGAGSSPHGEGIRAARTATPRPPPLCPVRITGR